MKLSKLEALCLQFLEMDSDTNTANEEDSDGISSLQNNDTFSEYLNNFEHTIFMALTRFSQANILPVQEIELKSKITNLRLSNVSVQNETNNNIKTYTTSQKIYNKIHSVYSIDSAENIRLAQYTLIGTKLILDNYNKNLKYYCVYYPSLMYLDNYADGSQTNVDIELTDLKVTDSVLGEINVCIPDDMAIMTKYMVYSEMKLEENANVATSQKNIFESYITEAQTIQVEARQKEIIGINYGDTYEEDSKNSNDDFYDYNMDGD